jgi:hypothetical protein
MFTPGRQALIKRWAIVIGVPLVAGLILFLMLWNVFFRYVPPGHMLVITAKNGKTLEPERTVARAGEQGIQEEVLAEGWHFITPVIYTTELHKNVEIPPGMAGIVTALGGKPLPPGRFIADQDDQKGIRRQVLLPGSYRLNPYAYKIEQVKAVEILPGHVGVQRRLDGKEARDIFAEHDDEKGILHDVLQPGIYYVNTKEYEIQKHEVGIYQTSYHYDPNRPDSGISFPGRDGYNIVLDCTIEWEILPKNVPDLAVSNASRREIEKNVIDQQARKICRDRGFDYGAQDFLEGDKREAFQTDFTTELSKVCQEKKVNVKSAFIRNIIIPETFLKPKRDRQVAIETKVTNLIKQEVARSDAEVRREQAMIDKSVAEVKAETGRMVANVKQEIDSLTQFTDAEIEKIQFRYAAQIAEQDSQRKLALAGAETQVTRLKEMAKSNIYKLKLDVFANDGNANLRYSLADQLNPNLKLRLFHSGPGTFWTNMDAKNMSLMLAPANGETKPKEEAKPKDKK